MRLTNGGRERLRLVASAVAAVLTVAGCVEAGSGSSTGCLICNTDAGRDGGGSLVGGVDGQVAQPLPGADGGATTPGDPAFEIEWRLEYVGGDQVTCEDAGTPTVEVLLVNRQTGLRHTKEFRCRDGRGVTDTVPRGSYDFEITLLGADGGAFSGLRVDQISAVSGGLRRLEHAITFGIQSWDLEWTLMRQTPTGPVRTSCLEVGAVTVELLANVVGEAPASYRFECERGAGTTQAIRTGTYAVQLKLLDGAARVLATEEPAVVAVDGNRRARFSTTITVP